MRRGCWKVDDNDEGAVSNTFYKRERNHNFSHQLWHEMYTASKTNSYKAVYIDLEEEEQRGENKIYSRWSDLPDLLLEKIFSYLSIREKYYASLVCKSWYRAFYLPYVWSQFVLEDNTLTRGRFNYYSGWQYVLDHLRTQTCLSQVGRNFRKLTFEPTLNFHNLYEFMNMISWCTEQDSDNPEFQVGRNVHTLKFTFPCHMASRDQSSERMRVFGTGGKILSALKRLMSNLKKLRRLELIDLMLESQEAQFLLDEVCERCCLTLQTLSVINATKVQYELFPVGVFLNLQVLYISPQNLGDDVIELLSHTKIEHIHIVQNRYTPNDIIIRPVSFKTWKMARKVNPNLKVHLQLECMKERAIIWQQGAPVHTVLYDSPYVRLREDHLITVIEFFKDYLRIYGHKNRPRFPRSKSFHDRVDGSLMLLVRQCPHLTTLIITERISTCTALLLAYTGKNLKYLFIRGNAVILRCDWPQSPEWSDEFYTWVKISSRSYELVEKEISQIMGRKWQFLTDKQFKRLHCNLHEL